MENRPLNQQAMDLGTEGAPLMPSMGAIDKISPIVEYLLQMLGQQQQQPRPSTTSQQVGPYMGPRPTPQQTLRGSMMPQRDPNATY